MEEKTKKLYLVVSQTGTIVSQLLKLITRKKYNHVSIALDETLEPMYSFARKYTYCPFFGSFMKESRFSGTFRRFPNTKAVVLALPVTETQYETIRERLKTMYAEREKYGYNYRALAWAFFGKVYRRKNRYYCSEFARNLLEETGVLEKGVLGEIVYPVEFLDLPEAEKVYDGLLCKYRTSPPADKPAPTERKCKGADGTVKAR